MENEPEVIREQMDATRTDLTKKLEQLEQSVVGTVQETTDAVSDTVKKVQEAVQDTVQSVKGSFEETVEEVRETFNISRHVQQHPWLMVGGAFAVGYVAGTFLRPAARMVAPTFNGMARSWQDQPSSSGGSFSGASLTPTSSSASAPASQGPSMLSSVSDMFGPEVDKLKGLAIGALLGTLREVVTRQLPPQYSSTVGDVVNSVTTKLGGKPT